MRYRGELTSTDVDDSELIALEDEPQTLQAVLAAVKAKQQQDPRATKGSVRAYAEPWIE